MFLPKPKRSAPDPATVSEIYIDETSQTKHRYLLLGAIIVPLLDREEAEADILSSRLPELPNGELKWGKISRGKIDAYRRVIDQFFDSAHLHRTHFHCLVIDTKLIDDRVFNEGDREIGFNKEIYQLATKCARLYRGVFHLYPDSRETSQHPENLRQILNRGRRKSGDLRDWPFRRCQFRDSKKSQFLQLTDILLGSVAYSVNGHASASNASAAKSDLASHVLARAGVNDPMIDTARFGKFTIWHRQLQKIVPRP